MKRKHFILALVAMLLSFVHPAFAQVAKVGNTEYATIDEAIAKWTNGSTLTLLDDVTLLDVIQLSSTEHHILDLGTYTMTAASKKDAIQIVNNGRSSASYALDIKADADNPGGITATGKAIVRTAGKSGVKDRPIIRFYNGVFNASYIVYHTGSNGTNCPQFQFHNGVFNGTIYTNRALNQFYGGVFTGSLMMSVDSSAYTLIAGGSFKQLSNLYMSALNSGKFTIGSAKGVYDKEVYVDDNGNYVIATAEPSEGIEAAVAKTPGTNDYLAYSKVATEGALNYTNVETALKNNKSATVTVYADEVDMSGINFTGTIVVPEGEKITIVTEAGVTPTWTVSTSEENSVTYTDDSGNELVKGEDGAFVKPSPVTVDGVDVVITENGNSYDIKLGDGSTFPETGVTMTFAATGDANGMAYVVHEHEGKNYIYVGKVADDKISFKNTVGFSTFTVNAGGLTEAVAAAQSGDIITLIEKGAYTIPEFAGKELTIKALDRENTSITDYVNKGSQGMMGSTVHFVNLTINGATENYYGLFHTAKVTYTNCIINGLRFLYATEGVSFEGCAFNANGVEHSFWTYGASNVTVKNSTFTYTDRAVNCYSENGAEHEADITFEGCSFTYAGTNDAPEGAVEINSGSAKSFDIAFTGCTAPEKGAMWFNSQWDSKKGENTVVEVDDVIVWQVVKVAKIGDVEYTSLQAAFNAVQDGETITLVDNVTISAATAGYTDGTYTDGVRYTGDKSFTVDFNGKTVTDDGCVNDYLIYINNKGEKASEITFTNGTIVSANGCWSAVCVNSSAATQNVELNLNGMNITNSNDAVYSGNPVVRARDLATVNVNDGTTITSNGASYGVAANTDGSTVNINEGATIVQQNSGTTGGNSVFAAVGGKGVINIKGGTITSDRYGVHTMTTGTPVINISGGTITAPVALKSSTNGGNGELATINVTGGTINGTLETYTDNGKIVVSGGTFSEAVAEEYCADGFVPAENADGTFGVEKAPVASINGTKYTSLAEAVAAAQAGDEIVLTADVKTTDGVVITDKNLTIDLNGKTYTVTEGANTNNRNFKINGTSVVTVKNGTMVAAGEYSSGAYGTIRTEGTANVTLTGLKLYNYRGNGLNIKACTGTTVTIENTEIYANYGGGIESAGGTIVVNDGVTVKQEGMYTAPYNSMAISVNGGGKVTVNGGTFSTECITAEEANNQGTSHGPWVAGVLNSGGTLIINGGTFSNDNFGENSLATAARGAILADTKAKVEINGGTFNVLKNVIDIQNNLGDTNNNPSVLLVGGTYSADPRISAQYGSNLITLAEDYIAVENNGVWNVVKVVAKIGDVEYASLQDALDAAAAGTGNVTVSILADVNLTGVDWNPVTVSAPGYPVVTVEGNNKTITGLNDMLFAGTWAGGSGLIIKNLTIENSAIVNDKDDAKGTVGVGAFIGFPQASATITLENCHLKNSSVEGGHWTGGLIGYAAGYAGNDGPVFMNLTIKNCSVTGSTITGKGSVGGVIGHGSGNAWTNVVIEETTVSNNEITSTGSSNVKAGAVMGTIGAAGQPTTVNGVTKTGGMSVSATVAENTVKSNGTEITTIYGRQGTATGMLAVAGGSYDNYPIEEGVAYAAPAAGYKIEQNTDGTYGVVVDPEYGKVASVNGVYYETLAAAVDAVEDGGTITLIANETFTENNRYNNGGWWDGLGYSGDKSFTIDLANFTISQDGALNDYLMWFKNDGAKANTITLKNGTLDAGTTAYSALATSSSNAQKITVNLENIKVINNNSNGAALKIRAGAELNVKAGTEITGKDSYLGIECWAATVNIYDGAEIHMNGTSSYNGCLAGVGGNGTINVYGGEGKGVSGGFIAMTSGGTINIEGGEWTANTDGTYANSNKSVLVAQSENGAKSIVNVTGGTFKGGYNCYGAAVGDAQINIKGGNFNANPTSYVADGYVAVENNGVWNVVKAAAQIGSIAYTTIDAALNAAQAGDVVTIAAGDYAQNLSINKAITVQGETNTVSTLSTAADSVSNNLVNFTGKLNITADGATVKNINVNNGNSSAGYINAMNVTVDGCQVVGGNGFRSCYTKGTVTFKNSVITGSTYGIHFDGSANGNIVIDNCIITGWTSFASTINNVAIKDSKFAEGNYNQLRFYQDVTIENTEFNENMTIDFGKDEVSAEFTNCTVSNGGKLTDVIYLADIVDMGIDVTVDGMSLAVSAKIGSTYYPTLAEAITAAKASDTITFVSDINESVTVNKNVTIDGANKKYTGTMTGNAGLNVTVQNVNFVNGGFDKSTKSTTGTYTIKDCTFDGAGSYAYAFRFKGANKVVVENCTVKDYLYSFLYVTSGTNTVSVKNVTVENCPSYAVYFSSGVNSATFENLTVKNSNNGFVINNTANRAFTIKDCKMENVTTAINHSNGTNTITCTALGVNNLGKTVDELSLSQYAVIKGANVGTYYGTLQSMVEKAENGQTVKLLSDIALTTKDELASCDGYPSFVHLEGKAVTVDLNGKAITVNASAEELAGKMLVGVFSTDNSGELTLVDSSAEGTGSVTLTANDAKVYSLLCNYEDGCKMTINGGTYTADKVHDCLVYSGGKTDAIATVNGGNFTLGNVGAGENGKPWIFNVLGAGDHHVLVNGGTFNADINRQHWSNEVYVAKECYTVANTDGTYTVKEGAVAYVNEGMLTGPYFVRKNIGYATLAEAMAEVDTDETVTMLKDVTLEETVTITADKKNITLDLAGKTISMNDASGKGAYAIKNNGSLTIKDAGENGKITFKSTTPDNSFGYATSTIGNAGKLTVESGTIENTTIGGASYAIDGIWHTDTVSLTINGGTIIANKIAVRQVPFSATAKNVVTVNGGILQGATAGLQLHNTSNDAMLAEVNINGGEFFGDYGFYTSFSSASASSKAVINITDGTFHGYPYIYNGKNGSDATPMTVSVTGGYFDNMPYIYTKDANGNAVNIPAIAGGTYGYDVTDYCADDFRCVQNADGRYTVERCVFEFVDGEVTEFSNDKDIEDVTITYKRTFRNVGAWQTLYVPFEIPVSELTDKGYSVAYVNDVQALDRDEDGDVELTETTIEYVYIKNGILRANHPYVIKPTTEAAKNMELVLNNATLKAASAENQVTIDISTAYMKFDFKGTLSKTPASELGANVFSLNNSGNWMQLGPTVNLGAFRVYLTMENKDGSPVIIPEGAEIRARVIGEKDEVTGIFTPYVENETRIKEGIFDLMGRPVRTPEKGKIYIMNGKKVLF